MRIIAGSLKGRRIPFNPGKYGGARTTPEMVKKAAFSILGEDLTGENFLDLFACSGQIGLEALSRGARVVANEPDKRRCRFIADLVARWELDDHVRVTCQPAQKAIALLDSEGLQFDAVYLDPPYGGEVGGTAPAVGVLTAIGGAALVRGDGAVLVQHAARIDLPPSALALAFVKRRTYGDSALTLYRASGV